MPAQAFGLKGRKMIDRRLFSILLLGSAGTLGACAGGGGPSPGGADVAAETGPDMLFISPMGEPFRAKPPQPYPVVAWFKQADKDGDGKLTLDEFQADAERFFHVLDINKDGVIDHREIYYYEHKICPEILGQAYGALHRRRAGEARLWLAQFGGGGLDNVPTTDGHDTASKAPDGGRLGDKDAPLVGAAAYGLLADPEPVQGCDLRLTGAITLTDFKTRAAQRFDILDDGHRGYLTLKDLPETEAQKLMPKPRHGARRV
jgi:hypothetical protein